MHPGANEVLVKTLSDGVITSYASQAKAAQGQGWKKDLLSKWLNGKKPSATIPKGIAIRLSSSDTWIQSSEASTGAKAETSTVASTEAEAEAPTATEEVATGDSMDSIETSSASTEEAAKKAPTGDSMDAETSRASTEEAAKKAPTGVVMDAETSRASTEVLTAAKEARTGDTMETETSAPTAAEEAPTSDSMETETSAPTAAEEAPTDVTEAEASGLTPTGITEASGLTPAEEAPTGVSMEPSGLTPAEEAPTASAPTAAKKASTTVVVDNASTEAIDPMETMSDCVAETLTAEANEAPALTTSASAFSSIAGHFELSAVGSAGTTNDVDSANSFVAPADGGDLGVTSDSTTVEAATTSETASMLNGGADAATSLKVDAVATAGSGFTVAAAATVDSSAGANVRTFNPVSFHEDVLIGETLSPVERGLLQDPQNRTLAEIALQYAWNEALEKHNLSTAVCDPPKSVARVLAAANVEGELQVLRRLAFERNVWTASDLKDHLFAVGMNADGGFAGLLSDKDRESMARKIFEGNCYVKTTDELLLSDVQARVPEDVTNKEEAASWWRDKMKMDLPADVLDMYDEQYLKKRREEVQRQKKLAQDLLVGRKKAEFKERKHPAH